MEQEERSFWGELGGDGDLKPRWSLVLTLLTLFDLGCAGPSWLAGRWLLRLHTRTVAIAEYHLGRRLATCSAPAAWICPVGCNYNPTGINTNS